LAYTVNHLDVYQDGSLYFTVMLTFLIDSEK